MTDVAVAVRHSYSFDIRWCDFDRWYNGFNNIDNIKMLNERLEKVINCVK